MDIRLDAQEASLLQRVVHNRFAELRLEVRHAGSSESKEYLRHKERLLRRILAKFPDDMDIRAHREAFL